MKIPADAHAFDELMFAIDRELAESGHDIPRRPIRALSVVSERFEISMPLTKPHPGAKKELVQNWPIAERILQWYSEQYGDRLKVDHSPGRMVIKIDGDVWGLRFPRIFGSAKFVVSRTKIARADRVSRHGPVPCNVVEFIEGMTTARMRKLRDSQLYSIFQQFNLGLRAFDILEASSENKLIWLAHGDVRVAADFLTSRPAQYGASKWASLQATEKVMKANIALQRAPFSHTHDLKKLARELSEAGIQGDWTPFIEAVQCLPGIRYAEESCCQDDAIAAHHASLGLITALFDADTGLQSSLSWQP